VPVIVGLVVVVEVPFRQAAGGVSPRPDSDESLARRDDDDRHVPGTGRW